MAEAIRKAGWAPRLTQLALLLCFGGLLAALIAAVGSGQGAWHFRTGFTILRYALFAAIGGMVLALVALLLARRRRSGTLVLKSLLALVAGLGFVLYLGSQIRTARSVPAIHDISTNLDDLPRFATLAPRQDSLETVPDEDPALKGQPPEARWKALHRRAYGDLKTVRVPWPVGETVTRAERLARDRGWEIARADPQAGTLEATDTTFFFRFKDDVAVRVRPAPGGGSLVDMRSVSRVGGSDVGVNAKRIRAFLKDLQQG